MSALSDHLKQFHGKDIQKVLLVPPKAIPDQVRPLRQEDTAGWVILAGLGLLVLGSALVVGGVADLVDPPAK